MSKKIRQPFTPGGKFIAAKAFTFHGRKYAPSDEFPWRRLSCSIRKLKQLYEGRYLNNDYVDLKEVEDELPELVEESFDSEATATTGNFTDVEAQVDGSMDDEVGDESPGPITVYDPDVHEIVNPERGEWYLNLDNVRMLRLTAKEAKRLRKSMEPTEINLDKIIIEE